MISIVAYCHGAKLCAHAARDFRSQQSVEIVHCVCSNVEPWRWPAKKCLLHKKNVINVSEICLTFTDPVTLLSHHYYTLHTRKPVGLPNGGIQIFKNRFSHSGLTNNRFSQLSQSSEANHAGWPDTIAKVWSLCCQLIQSRKGNFRF